MKTNGWDTISVLNISEVNKKLQDNLSQLIMSFKTSWTDGFAGSYDASGEFLPWSITGGSGTDVYIEIPIKSGTITPQGGSEKKTDITGMSITLEVNLEWIPSTVSNEGSTLQFDLSTYVPKGSTKTKGGVYVKSFTDPNNTGFGEELGQGIAKDLIANKAEITFIFAQMGVTGSGTPSWIVPVKSVYSYHAPSGSNNAYMSILSVTSNKDISSLSANIDPGLIPSGSNTISFTISGDLFLENIILPALPGAFEHANSSNFSYSNGAINLASSFDLKSIREGAIDYDPQVTSMKVTIDSNAIKNSTSGNVYLDMPNAHLDFSATTNNVMDYDASTQKITFQKDPNPSTSSSSHVPWYDYILTLGAIGAAITAIVLAAVESGLGDSLASSSLAGSLSAASPKSIDWGGTLKINSGELNDCFLLQGEVN
jgi:hypothetical protein